MSATHLLWLDLETTGSDARKHQITELGAILTTRDLTILDQRSWRNPAALDDLRLTELDPTVLEMHAANGLWRELLADSSTIIEPRTLHEVESEILEWLTNLLSYDTTPCTVALAGSGVGHFDQPFLRLHMPRLSAALAYYTFDVGVLRRFIQLAGGNPAKLSDGASRADSKTHRALDDAHQHLAEAERYIAWLRNAWNSTLITQAAG